MTSKLAVESAGPERAHNQLADAPARSSVGPWD